MDQNAFTSWQQRRAKLRDLNELPSVSQAQSEALYAASKLPQTDENAANTCASNVRSIRLIDQDDDCERLGRQLDLSMAILWSIKKDVGESNATRLGASSALKSMSKVALSDSSRDFISINCLESNREGTVELVRSRFDRQIYILKSTTKGAAKRGYKSNTPMNERRLLTLARKESKGHSVFTPACIAAFQSQASLHILMEYCPAGDLYHFLESAGQAPGHHEARNTSGGLLAHQYVRAYAIDIVAAISWLHTQGYMHRDIKPGNWLIDRSGHLLMCDLASSAPFALFDEIPATASLPKASGGGGSGGLRKSKYNQKRVLYRHCCLIGTADYIAPEIFWSADLMSRRRQRQYDSYSSSISMSRSTIRNSTAQSDEEGEDDDEPPPEGPGLYGPECDWWSVGVLLYEMVYKQLPFFSEKIADTMEMIKKHEKYFRMDHRVACPDSLRDLISSLITGADERLGKTSSSEVQQHPFFIGVDWTRPWQTPPPFVPHLPASAETSDQSYQPEPSILHSPKVGQDSYSFDAGPMNWSKVWSSDGANFPVFPNSVEMSRAAFQPGSSSIIRQGNDDESVDSCQDSALNIHFTRIEEADSSKANDSIDQWTGLDPTWIGFSYVPPPDAFEHELKPTTSSPIIQRANLSSASDPILGSESIAPIESTPPALKKNAAHGNKIEQRPAFGPRASLHRHAMEIATRMRGTSGTMQVNDGRFVTPIRQTSYSNLLATATVQGDGSIVAGIPASPYPFPVAESARPKKTPYVGSVLKRNDLERARSASATSGEGSDSRCSGGSNAKRDISEREAWRELKIAVMQSARKGKRLEQEGIDYDEDEDQKVEMIQNSHDTMADESHVPKNVRKNKSEEKRSVKFKISPAGKGRPSLSRLLSDERQSRRALEPILDTSPSQPFEPTSPTSTDSSASPESSMSRAEDRPSHDMNSLTAFNTTPKMQAIGKRKSARQLLLKAQHRDTPTRIARTASPMLIEPPGNLTALLDRAVDGASAGVDNVFDDKLLHSSNIVLRQRAASFDGSGAIPKPARSSSADEKHTKEMAPPTVLQQFRRRNSHMMIRRRDSHEIMSQYRKGVNPDAGSEVVEDTSKTTMILPNPIAQLSRPALAVAISLDDVKMRHMEGALSSPSLPCFPDAFGGTSPTNENMNPNRKDDVLRPLSAPVDEESVRHVIKQSSALSLQPKQPQAGNERQNNETINLVKPLAIRATNTMNLRNPQREIQLPIIELNNPLSPKSRSIYGNNDGDNDHILSDTKVTHKPLRDHSQANTMKQSTKIVHPTNPQNDRNKDKEHNGTAVYSSSRYDQLQDRYDQLQDHIEKADYHLARLKARLLNNDR